MSNTTTTTKLQAMYVQVQPGSAAERSYWIESRAEPGAETGAILPGVSASPQEDLIFRGGKTIAQMQFKNFFLGGAPAWQESDVTKINRTITDIMRDPQLNNVLTQYFAGKKISCDPLPFQFLNGNKPSVVTKGDLEQFVSALFAKGVIPASDLGATIFNFLLPSGTALTTDATLSGNLTDGKSNNLPQPDLTKGKGNSLHGLGGFHGSVKVKAGNSNATVYYSANVFSERLPDGTANGIPVFNESWKNVVATLYHELCEFRTDPDVGEANRTGNGELLGWVSRKGNEIGDFPLVAAGIRVFKEVALTNTSVTVPVQFQYSNAVHGPEGPILKPH